MPTLAPEPTVIIRADRAAMFEKRHPWVFSGAVEGVQGSPADGDIVALRDPSGGFLGRGYWNSQSQIRVHILSWDEAEPIDRAFWRSRLARAAAARSVEENRRQGAAHLAIAYRLVNAESDGLPGLIVDRYGAWLVLQALTLGIEQRKAELVGLLLELLGHTGIRGIYERSDVDVRAKEGLAPSVGVLAGEAPPDLIEIDEYSHLYLVDVRRGHKTGFYLDQRENRIALAYWLSADEAMRHSTVLNCFSYTGGFAVAALELGGARRVINVDSSAEVLALARRNVALNERKACDEDFVVGDVFDVLRQYRAEGRQFDVIVLDPPKFAHHQRQIESAARGYKDINMLAFQLIRPGGLLMTFSCSGLVSADLFQKIVFGALIDARREAQILQRLTAAPDHPVALTFPEGFYLKGLVCRVW